MQIKSLHAFEALDSRGVPTVAARLTLVSGRSVTVSVPSGTSTGKFEACELRDGDMDRYSGMGVKKPVMYINKKIAPLLLKKEIKSLRALDSMLLALDGTPDKSHLGANTILAVSWGAAQAMALEKDLPLYRFLREAFFPERGRKFAMPIPLLNVLNGGTHADSGTDIQEFWVVPTRGRSFALRLQCGLEVFHALGALLSERGLPHNFGLEGGYATNLGDPGDIFSLMNEAARIAGYRAGYDLVFGMDLGASELFETSTERYIFSRTRKKYSAMQMRKLLREWSSAWPLRLIEDPLAEDEWAEWSALRRDLRKDVTLIGDDLTVTSKKRIVRAAAEDACDAVIIKMNQIGSVSETVDAIKACRDHDLGVILSHRSGETCDSGAADLAVSAGAEYVKFGASRGERIAKYNRLLEIEEEI